MRNGLTIPEILSLREISHGYLLKKMNPANGISQNESGIRDEDIL
jgi:hypothetical protein